MKAPATQIAGRWEVKIDFFNSSSIHVLNIEQDGNWLTGNHKGEFTLRDLAGTIEGDELVMRSVERMPGDHVTFLFTGKIVNGTISGDIYLGEYRTAKFTASKYKYRDKRERIMVPGGPPLAT